MPLTVRAFTKEDARAVAVIHVECWQKAYRGAMPDAFLDALSVDQRTEQWSKSPRHAEHRIWLAVDEDRIVGFVLTGPSRDADAAPLVSEIFAIYVAPDRWGTGAGRLLVEHVFADLQARGASEVSLWVVSSNERAKRFYGRAGFRADGGVKVGSFGGADVQELRYRASCNGSLRPT
jgi:ribosomal protein S18 acetylase RimI-like enzyme